jgi:hypothetical protein
MKSDMQSNSGCASASGQGVASGEGVASQAAVTGSFAEGSPDDVVGHKTMQRPDGSFWHEPLTRAQADEITAIAVAAQARRKELMPDEESAISMLFEAWVRLKEFGWREAIYCPKDGREFLVIETGSTGQHRCRYDGEWPDGAWWILSHGDLYPSRPTLFKDLPK